MTDIYNQEREIGKICLEESLAINRLNTIISELSTRYNMSQKDIINLLKKRENYITIPIYIFNNELSPLETIALYLHIKFDLSQTTIANILKRDHTTIWTTLNNSLKKINRSTFAKYIEQKKEGIFVPVEIFAHEKLSILESISLYLKDNFDMSYHEIAISLGKDDRTIWTVINRARKKLK